ncbi:serine hydrolase [Bacillus sp. 1P02SD]|uniref:serine hydrolase n=1 Tax=Bacillus sp. 1P02SD TaxID=3132264 RepID=UPI0039A2C793
MLKILEKVNEIESGEVGMIIFSQLKQEIVLSHNEKLVVPLASAAKVAIGFCIAKSVEEGNCKWYDIIKNISYDPNEDSNELYPHFQNRENLTLQEAVEVMIACHDQSVANSIVQFLGGWEKANQMIKSYFPRVNISPDPRSSDNKGELNHLMNLLCEVYQGYEQNPVLWHPLLNGLVRQRGEIDGIPSHLLNHMTGGLEDLIVDMGIMGEFTKHPLLYVLGAKNLPNRYQEKLADEKIMEVMKKIYNEYCDQGDAQIR